jgi:hypothetical protein
VKIHLLIGLKLTGNRKRTGQIATHDRDNRGRSRLLGRSFAIVISNDEKESCQQKAEKPRTPKDSLTMHGATYFQSRKFGIGIDDSTSPSRELAITPTVLFDFDVSE